MRKLLAFYLVLPCVGFAQGFDINYTLPKDGKVSLAVYDAEGRMVRTLRNAQPQTAGKQTVKWDGLMMDGQAAPAGEYSWKLLLSQGMKAEYLLSLGTSVGVSHWPSQHGGPHSVEMLENGDVFSGGYPEGSPLMARLHPPDSSVPWVIDSYPSQDGGAVSISAAEGVMYALLSKGVVRVYDPHTGKKAGETFMLTLPVAELGTIAPTQEKQILKFASTAGGFKVRTRITLGSGGGELKITAGGKSFPLEGLQSGKEVEVTVPGELGFFDGEKTTEIELSGGPFTSDWSASSVEILARPTRLSAWAGVLAAVFPLGEKIGWFDTQGKVLANVPVPAPRDIALLDAETALVLSGNELLEVKRDGSRRSLIKDLVSPKALTVDRNSGQIFVSQEGASNQIKRFSKAGKLEATFGRAGGRQAGVYVPENFLGVADLSADGKGGFWVCENLAAPRRTAHFDSEGKLLGEWYGGQQFYTWAAPDPDDADVFWMDSQWGWIMQVKADWEKRDWKVLATYRWGDDYPQELVNRYKMAQHHSVKKLDLDKDGKKETYLLSSMGMQKVDEAAGRLRMVSSMSEIGTNRSWEWDKVPLEKQPKPWLDAIALLGEDPAKEFKNYRAFSWADANGDYQFQPDEFRLAKKLGVGGRGGFHLTEDLSVLKSVGWGGKPGMAVWDRYPLQGFTASHAPIWDWTQKVPGHILATGNSKDFWISPEGDTYQILFGLGGDGYTGLDTWEMGHGFTWPANLADATALVKWNPKGEMLWKVGSLPIRVENHPGQLQHPVRIIGLVNGTVGVGDKVVQPVVFWTEDGLYAGGLFDRRVEDGLPKRAYRWWTGGTDDFNPETGRALIQYDMILGGSLVKRPNGEVLFVSSGWNNCPVFRVTGWDEFERLEGKITVAAPVPPAPQKGTGLTASYYRNPNWKGKPAFTLAAPRVWQEPARAKKRKLADLDWPYTPTIEPPKLKPETQEKVTSAPADPPPLEGKFSARWTGFVEPLFTEDYTFAIYRKHGEARLWVNDQLVIEPSEKGPKDFSKPIALKAGKKYSIKMEWSGEPKGEIHLVWESASQQVTHLPTASLYPSGKK